MFKLASSLQHLVAPDDRRQWPILLGVSLVSGLSRSLFLALVSTAVASRGSAYWTYYVVGIVLLVLAIIAADYFSAIRGREVSTRLAMRLRDGLLERIASANLRFVEQEQPNRLHYHLMHTIGVVAGTYFVLLSFANSLVTLTFNFLYIGWLSLAGLAFALLISLVGVRAHWYFEKRNEARRKRLDELSNLNNGCHLAYLLGYKELRLSRAKEADYRNQLNVINADILRESMAEGRISITGGMATSLFQYLAIAAAALLLPQFTSIEPMKIMQLLAAILFTIGPLEGVVGAFSSFGRARVAMDNLHRLTDAAATTHEGMLRAQHAGLPPFESLSLRDVTFAFDEATGPESFHLGPIDFELRQGEVVFVVGGNGSGKTVLMRLLTGLYRPCAGSILYNGRPLSDQDRQALREQYATVFNDFFLFAELLGMRDTPRDTVLGWLSHFDLAGKTDFRAHDGCFTTVDLSTGQRKRMALIVALLEKRPLMVLDEFGADQDPEHREMFYRQWLPELRRMGCTLVVVSHDDRYFDTADRVVRMDYGRISEVRKAC